MRDRLREILNAALGPPKTHSEWVERFNMVQRIINNDRKTNRTGLY